MTRKGARRRGRRGTPRLALAVAAVTALVASSAVIASVSRASAGHPGGPASAGGSTRASRVGRLIARMTLPEKLTLLEGVRPGRAADQSGYLPGIPRLGIPSLRLLGGPPGLPSPMELAATFSIRDAYGNGVVIGRDTRDLGADAVLGPVVNIDRDPAWSGSSAAFGEDPLLTGQTAAAEITGIQSQHTMAMAGQYIAAGGGGSVVVDAQPLHEIYLQPYADAVRAGLAAVICSASTCDSAGSLTGILRGELGFGGFVSSGWAANRATLSVNSGLDLDLPGPHSGRGAPAYFSVRALRGAIASGSVRVATINQAVGRILAEMSRFGLLGRGRPRRVSAEPISADEQVGQRTAEDAATLLKNDGQALPLTSGELSSLALIGPDQTLEQELRNDSAARLSYAVGDDQTGSPVPASALSHDGQPGLLRTDAGGPPRVTATLNNTLVNGAAFGAGSGHVWTGELTAPETGSYWVNLGLLGAGGSITLDGKVIARTSGQAGAGTGASSVLPTTDGLDNLRTEISLSAGTHTLSVSAVPDASGSPVQASLDWVTPAQAAGNIRAAVDAARAARAAVVFAWSSGGPGALPDGQDQLIEDVAAVNPDTIVVLNTGGPVAMPWLRSVRSVLEMWYPGNTGSYATASVLLGRTDPAGRLPVSWPAGPGAASQQAARPERIFVGYRWYDQRGQTPLFPFGYGLSYTRFSYTELRWLIRRGGGLTVSFRVSNTGRVAGDVVPQVYLGAPQRPPPGVAFAARALAAYTRLTLAAGQARTVSLRVPRRQLQYWDTARGWTTAAGRRPLYVADNERASGLAGTVTVPG